MNPSRYATLRRWGRVLFLGLAGLYAAGMGLFLLLRLWLGDGPWWLALLNSAAPYTFLPLVVFLPVALWQRIRVLVAALAGLALIGGLWFGPYFLPHSAPDSALVEDAPSLRIVTFNVWGHNPRLAEVEAWLREMDADLVLMQEIPERYGAEGVPALADLYPYQVAQPASLRQYGNLILSRYPILQAKDIDLEGDGVPSQQRLIVEANGQSIAVYNVHLLMPVREQSRLALHTRFFPLAIAAHFDDTGRNAQIARLVARLEVESLPVIVGGDFNLSDQSVTYEQLASHLTDAFRAAGQGFGFSWPTADAVMLPSWFPPLLRIDYVWLSAAFVPVSGRVGPELGSDHRPVVIDLRQR